MKRIINVMLLIVCLTAICKTGKAQQANKQSNTADVPVKVTAIKAPVAKPIVPGGEFKPAETLALPAGKTTPAATIDRTVIPNPALNIPVNTMPAVADAKPAAVVKQEPAVQTPAAQHN